MLKKSTEQFKQDLLKKYKINDNAITLLTKQQEIDKIKYNTAIECGYDFLTIDYLNLSNISSLLAQRLSIKE